MNKYKRLKKVTRNAFVAGFLLFFIFLTWMFSPVITSINSVGKDFFLVDKSNIVIYVRSRLISTIKDFNLTDGVRVLKSTVLNESRNRIIILQWLLLVANSLVMTRNHQTYTFLNFELIS